MKCVTLNGNKRFPNLTWLWLHRANNFEWLLSFRIFLYKWILQSFDIKLYSGRIKATHILYGFVSHPLHVYYVLSCVLLMVYRRIWSTCFAMRLFPLYKLDLCKAKVRWIYPSSYRQHSMKLYVDVKALFRVALKLGTRTKWVVNFTP
jgi:hypothetical protein